MMIPTTVNPPSASVCAIAASTGVSTLKCDGTPRQAWSETKNVSTTQAAVNKPSKMAPERFLIGGTEPTTVPLIRVKPNERPNVAGLRNDNGPSHVPPLVTSMARWMTPLRISRAPVQYAARSMAFTSQVRPGALVDAARAAELGSARPTAMIQINPGKRANGTRGRAPGTIMYSQLSSPQIAIAIPST